MRVSGESLCHLIFVLAALLAAVDMSCPFPHCLALPCLAYCIPQYFLLSIPLHLLLSSLLCLSSDVNTDQVGFHVMYSKGSKPEDLNCTEGLSTRVIFVCNKDAVWTNEDVTFYTETEHEGCSVSSFPLKLDRDCVIYMCGLA